MAQLEVWNEENFAENIAQGVVLVDFWASWCGPCKMMLPVLEKAAAELGDNVRVAKVSVEDSKPLAAKYQVRLLPTFLVFKNGEVVATLSNVQSKDKLVNTVKAHLD